MNTERKSIRDLQLNPAREGAPRRDPLARERAPRSYKKPLVVWGGGIALVLLLLVSLLPIMFPEASVSVTPREETYTLPGNVFSAVSDRTQEGLHFDMVSLTVRDSVVVPAQGKKNVSEFASGTITVANAYSKTSQRLIKNTRFQDGTGKIYRIRESIVVPGFTEDASGKKPGTLTVKVYADIPGAEQNISSGTFTIPGLKDKSDMYAGITATLATPISGGFIGERPVVTEADMKAASASLESRLKVLSQEEVIKKIPKGSVVLDGLSRYAFSEPQAVMDDQKATVSMEMTIETPMFDVYEFAKSVISVTNPPLATYPAQVTSLSSVQALMSADAPSPQQIGFTLSGTLPVRFDINTEALASALATVARADFQERLKAFPEVQTAELNIRPFWRNALPADPKDITIKVQGR